MALALVPALVRPRLRAVIVAGIFVTACGEGAPDSDPDSEPPPPPPPSGENDIATDTMLTLAWLPNTDPVEGYIVYHGSTPETAENLTVEMPVEALADEQAPSVSFNAGTDLSLRYGDSVCFRLRAYNAADVLSDWSEAACATL